MSKMNKYLALFSLLFLCNCISKMKAKDFTSIPNKPSNTKIVFGVELHYDGELKYFDKRSLGYCHLIFTGDDGKAIKQKVEIASSGMNYVLLSTARDVIYLNAINCGTYKVLYNKIRLRRVNQEIFRDPVKDEVNYGGHVKLDWTSKIFNISDLLILGHLGIQDKGPFSIEIQDHYDYYLDFMQDKFNISPDKSVNMVNKDIVIKTTP